MSPGLAAAIAAEIVGYSLGTLRMPCLPVAWVLLPGTPQAADWALAVFAGPTAPKPNTATAITADSRVLVIAFSLLLVVATLAESDIAARIDLCKESYDVCQFIFLYAVSSSVVETANAPQVKRWLDLDLTQCPKHWVLSGAFRRLRPEGIPRSDSDGRLSQDERDRNMNESWRPKSKYTDPSNSPIHR
jgi:hypothetical protein